ncbi:hypothetical protein ACS0TY_014588 [Phlomoides rotata]
MEDSPKSAFQTYTKQPFVGVACPKNQNKKMIELLRKENDRNLKHKMVERKRRKSHNQLYLALHQLLPYGTKSDKNSIQEMTVKQIEELRRCNEELSRKNKEMEMEIEMEILGGGWKIENAEINLKVDNPISVIDSMLEVLQCLKNSESTLTYIQSNFLDHQFSAAIEFETKSSRC